MQWYERGVLWASIRLCMSALSVCPIRGVYVGSLEGLRGPQGGSLVFRGCMSNPNLAHLRGKIETTWWFEYKAPPTRCLSELLTIALNPGHAL